MNNREKFLANADDELRKTLAHVFDKAVLAKKTGRAMFTDFLSEREYAQLLSREKYVDEIKPVFFGGYENATRVMAGFFEAEEEFPISAVSLTGRGIEKLTHPDFLGSVLSLGLERCCIGDIVPDEDRCVIFCENAIAQYVADSLKQVGGVYVEAKTEDVSEINIEQQFEEISGTVASLRADSVLSVMMKSSRSKAAQMIEAQRFFVNGLTCTKCDREMKENDVLTLRHFGKAVLSDVNGRSKKGRIFITLKKYK